MMDNDTFPPQVPQQSLWSKLLILLGLCILGTFLFTFVGAILGFVTTKIPIDQILQNMQNPQGQQMWYLMIIITGISHLGGFWLAGLAYLRWVERRHFDQLHWRGFNIIWVLPVLLLVLAFMPVNEIFVKMNENMQLPQSLGGVQSWMKEMEESTAALTKFLTEFSTFQQFIIAFIVIAVFAGVGEELIFRGILQNLFIKKFNNIHTGIWLSAIIFSTIHFQFYGFIPRMLLGAVFGYLYVWTGNLWVPIIAHIANNGLIVLATYLHTIGVLNIDPETAQTPVAVSAISALACVGFLYFFHKHKIDESHEHLL